MLNITIDVRDTYWKTQLRTYRKTVHDACEAAFATGKIKNSELAVVLASDAFIRDLNRTYRGKDKPTNVLSFPGEDGALGDIVLALGTIKKEAKDQGKTLRHHTLHLLVHGTLHLMGYDHESGRDAEKMEAIEIKILKKLGVSNPYL